MPTQTTNKKLARLKRRQQVAELSLQGWTQSAIAEKLDVSQPTVSTDLKAIQQEWLESAAQDVELARAQSLAELEMVKREAWKAWERSQQPAETDVVSGQCENRQMRRTRKQQHGNPRFLEIIQKSIAQKGALLGLDVTPTSDEEEPDDGLEADARRARFAKRVTTLCDQAAAAIARKGSDTGRSGRAGPDDQRGPVAAGEAPDPAEPGHSPGAG
jgi:transposase